MQPLHLRWLWLAGGIAQVAITLYAGLVPVSALPALGVSDRVEHSVGFLALTLWFSGLVPPRAYGWLGFALLGFGGALEWLQRATALGRVGDLGDVVADAIGIALGLVLARAGLGEWMRWVEARLFRL